MKSNCAAWGKGGSNEHRLCKKRLHEALLPLDTFLLIHDSLVSSIIEIFR